ncbi:MAG TPA: flavohemoglobin expression-modulating QEGLA motif protein, partial [Rhodanobacteraceae bacterium]|nr:flavohemoglobin expression-modulating QEGLA motif protein [Rhodanobacteraceae bacterium]
MNEAAAPAAEFAHYAALDRRLLEAVRGIRVLSAVSWPASQERKFLDALANGRETMPEIEYAKCDFSAECAELEAIAKQCDAAHPLGDYLQRSAGSWRIAA